MHRRQSIHEVNIKNETLKTVKETNKYECHLCEFETNVGNCFEVHGQEIHGFVYCQKCKYTAQDKSIMK